MFSILVNIPRCKRRSLGYEKSYNNAYLSTGPTGNHNVLQVV